VVDITPAIQEPVSVADAKAFARIEYPDDDALIAGLISMAREYVETAIQRTVAPRVRQVFFQGFLTSGGYYNRFIRSMGPNPWWLPSAQGIMQIRQPPLQGIMNVQYTDVSSGNLIEIYSSKLVISTGTPGRVMPVYGGVWPLARPQIDAVSFTFVAGYGLTAPLVESVGGPPSQTIMTYGQPTGGSFTLSWMGMPAAGIPWNASAGQVQSALAMLMGVGSSGVVCSGGPLPNVPVFVQWASSLASVYYQPPLTITPALTGDPAATMYVNQPPPLPWSIAVAIKQIVADSYENREASQSQTLTLTPASERALMPEFWGSYV
jgi:gp6-like head-tail connector protein